MLLKHSCLLPLILAGVAGQVCGAPMGLGGPAIQYATVETPFEIQFDADGYLYAGNDRNAYAAIYRIPPGGGAGSAWGTLTAYDPDALDVVGDFVYYAGQYDVFRTYRATGVSQRWADYSANRNISALVVDAAGDYGNVGDVYIGNARYPADIERIDAATKTPSTLVASSDIYIPRGLLFAAGSLYCVESDASIGLWEIGPTGALSRVDDGGFAWDYPNALAYSEAEDAFYVGDLGLDQVVRIPRTGGDATVVAWGFDSVCGITFDAAGNLYVSENSQNVIWQVPVPEPSLAALLMSGGLALVVFARRRRIW